MTRASLTGNCGQLADRNESARAELRTEDDRDCRATLWAMSTTTLTPSAAALRAADRPRRLAGLPRRPRRGSVMDLLDSTIAQTAAPAIRRDLGGSYADLEWISAAYTLAMSVDAACSAAGLAICFGRRRVLLVGIAGFVGASALCSLAPVARPR